MGWGSDPHIPPLGYAPVYMHSHNPYVMYTLLALRKRFGWNVKVKTS